MFVEIQNTLRRYRGQIIGWGLGLTLYSFLIISNYANIISLDINTFLGIDLGKLMAFLGKGIQAITTPVEFEQPLIIGIPILIGVASFATAWLKTYGKKNGSGSPINFHLIYSAMDSVLSCAIYGILIYGSF